MCTPACDQATRLRTIVPNEDALLAVSENDPGSLNVMLFMIQRGYFDAMTMLMLLDSKHLYGPNIAKLFRKTCSSDPDRFLYHLEAELPCQCCGEMSYTGPYFANMSEEEREAHMAARRFWKPGSYWGLKDPPQTPEYEYPIRTKLPVSS